MAFRFHTFQCSAGSSLSQAAMNYVSETKFHIPDNSYCGAGQTEQSSPFYFRNDYDQVILRSTNGTRQ